MIRRILVPLDGTEAGESVLPHVLALVEKTGAEVILLRADQPLPVENYMPLYDAVVSAAQEYLEGVGRRLAAEGARARCVARIGGVPWTVAEVARQERVSLVAMATRARKGLGRLLIGTVAERVARQSPAPVLVVHATDRGGRPFRNILVPVDGTGIWSTVANPAVDLARLFESRILVLRVIPRGAEQRVPAERERAERDLREAAARFRARGISTFTLLEEGDPSEVILSVCRFNAIDMIAMATHGRSGIPRFLRGSVTERVVRGAPVPVLVARSERRAAVRRAQ